MSQEVEQIAQREALQSALENNAMRQRQHVKRKQESHTRLQCWISKRHATRLAALVQQLEDCQASLIEQAIDLLYQYEVGKASSPEMAEPISLPLPSEESADAVG